MDVPIKNIYLIKKRTIVKLSLREPEVARAAVYRRLPRTVIVKILKRKPYAALYAENAVYLMDEKGVLFRKCPEYSERGLPRMYLSGSTRAELGRRCSGLARRALQCVSKASALGLKIDKISIDPAGDLCLNVVNSFYVKMGAPTELGEKLEVLDKMLNGRPELFNRIEYVDISCPTAPAIKWKRGSAGNS